MPFNVRLPEPGKEGDIADDEVVVQVGDVGDVGGVNMFGCLIDGSTDWFISTWINSFTWLLLGHFVYS